MNSERMEHSSILTLPEQLARLGRSWGWFFAVGIALIVFGILAFSWPVGSTLGLTFALGVLFVLSGITHGIQSIRLRQETGNGWRIFHAVAALAAGILMLRYPASGMLGVAITMTFYFFVSATVKGAIAFSIRPLKGWGWMLTSAVASFLLGVYIIATFPVSALWVPGFLLGIDFVVYGSSLIGFSFDLKRVHRKLQSPPTAEHFERKAG